MRRRIGAYLKEFGQAFEQYAEAEIGIATPWSKNTSWTTILETWDLEDVLNVVTILVQHAHRRATSEAGKITARRLAVQVFNRIFEQEHTPYRVDALGGVHFVHDEEFVRNAQATIAGLNQPRYVNSLDRFESAMKAITGAVPDGKTGIRNAFEAAEGLFRLMYRKAPRLTADFAAELAPTLQQRYAGDPAALGASSKLLASFKDWIEACQFYRHEPGKPEIHQPPIELALHLISVGAAFIRLLIDLDEGLTGKPPA